MKDTQRALEIANRIIHEGHPFERAWYDEGDVESGPSGGSNFGYRLGQAEVYLTQNNSVVLYARPRRSDEYDTGMYVMLYNTSTNGRAHWGDSARKDLQTLLLASRQWVCWVATDAPLNEHVVDALPPPEPTPLHRALIKTIVRSTTWQR